MDPFRPSTLSRGRAAVLLLTGAVIGALMITPGVAHVTDSLRHLTGHFDKRYAQTVQGHDVFAMVRAEIAGGIGAKAGPVAGVDRLDPGYYRVRFSQPFNFTSGEVFALVTAIKVSGESCSWHYHGTGRRQLRVRCFDTSGAPSDTGFTMLVFHRA